MKVGSLMRKLHLIHARKEDCELLWQWANDPETRRNSFHTEQITLEEHKAWLSRVLADENTKIYILLEKNVPVGQVRLSFSNRWQISYSIAPVFRGHGYGKLLLQMAEKELIQNGHVGDLLFAEVKKHNVASRKIFTSLGFKLVEGTPDEVCAYKKKVGVDEGECP